MLKDNKNEKIMENEELDEVNGGRTTYERKISGDGNIVGTNATFDQMLGALDELDKSGKLDYLKK